MQPYLLSIPLAPILFLQGKYAKAVTPRLPKAAGDRRVEAGHGAPLRLLILGDSAAAGVGAAQQENALAGALVRQLRDQFRVQWCLHARTGNQTADTLYYLTELQDERFDVVVVSTGVNDVTGGVSLALWSAQLRELHQQLRERFGCRFVLFLGVPPMGRFKALPQPLRAFIGVRAGLFDLHLQKTVVTLPGASYLAMDGEFDERALADDGFHPSEHTYQRWAEAVGQRLKSAWLTLENALEPANSSGSSGSADRSLEEC